ncbi:MAG TPA: Spy/CpxP family protein refolding chaperone [Caulobacteraceae bacterium]|nr:Spy/CpxP family protein refolding chaperone [Caulobacteraceae bacterium]
MNSTLKTLVGVGAAVVMTAAAATVLAQDGPPPGAPPSIGARGPGGPGGRGGPPSPEMREQMLRDRLGLRADQEPALKAFLESTRPQPPLGGRRAQRAMTTPERLDRQLAEMKQRVDATKRFYAQLSPEQKQTFDSTPMLAMGPEGGRGPGGRGGRRSGGQGFGGPNQGFGAPPPQ